MIETANEGDDEGVPVIDDLVRESIEGDLQEMARLEKEIEHGKSVDKTHAAPAQELKVAKATFRAANRGKQNQQSRGEREIHPTAEVKIEMNGGGMQRDQAAATSMNQFSSIQLSNVGVSESGL